MFDLHPLVSICIPTFNGAAYLEPCLQSALEQTYPNKEILVCDDGSTDNTVAIIKKYQQHHPQIKLIQNEENKGMVNNWNNCIKQAGGSWIKILFMDDVLQPNCVQKMMDACRLYNSEMAVCARDFIFQNDALPRISKYFMNDLVRPEHIFGASTAFVTQEKLAKQVKTHFLQNILGEPTCYFFHKHILAQIGLFNSSLRQLVDFEFILRAGLLKGIVFIPEALAGFRVHGASESSVQAGTTNKSTSQKPDASLLDKFILLHEFIYDPAFQKIKMEVGEVALQHHIRHIYNTGSKYYGEGEFKLALMQRGFAFNWEQMNLKTGFFKYLLYRAWVKRWEKIIKNEGGF